MIITINTDASYSNRLKLGAYAFWIVCNEKTITGQGAFRKSINGCTDAEIMCIANALHKLKQAKFKEPITRIVINTDSEQAIKHITGTITTNEAALFAQQALKSMLKPNYEGKINFEMKHVQAHKEVDSTRSWVNDWCDRTAKLEMGKILKKHKKANGKKHVSKRPHPQKQKRMVSPGKRR